MTNRAFNVRASVSPYGKNLPRNWTRIQCAGCDEYKNCKQYKGAWLCLSCLPPDKRH